MNDAIAPTMDQASLRIGTSGWHYRHWVGPFYPRGMQPREQLAFYAERFGTVEVNGTFYRLIAPEALARWRDGTPQGFLFACKGSRFLTHMKRLADCAPGLERFFASLAGLGEKLGPIVFQLPERAAPERARLLRFLDCLRPGHRYAFEFRNPAWFEPTILDELAARNIALCLYHFAGREAPLELTADFVYVRLHGPGGPYQGSYDDAALARWAERLRSWTGAGRDVYCYFDNDDSGHAPLDAMRLRAMLGQRTCAFAAAHAGAHDEVHHS